MEVLIPIILLAAISIYQDVTTQKIRNWVILTAIASGIIIFGTETIPQAILALTLGFSLFWFNLWAPGDAKLLVAYSILIPPNLYEHALISQFPALAILINAMVPAALFFIIFAIRNNTLDKQWKIFKSLNHAYLTFIVLLFFIAEYAFSFFTIDRSLALVLEIIFVMTSLKLIEFSPGWLAGSIVAFIGCYEWDSITQAPFAIFFIALTIVISWIFKLSSATYKKSKEIPFAIWMALGAILTLILKTDLISYIKYL